MTTILLVIAAVAAGTTGLLLLRRNGSGWRVGRLLAVAPQRSLADAVAMARSGDERYVRVHGRIDSDEEFPSDDDKPIVFRRKRLQRAGRRDTWMTVDDERLAVPFGITERGDTLMVDTDALGDGLVVVPRLSEGVASDIPADAFAGPPLEMPPDTPMRMRLDHVSSVEHATAAGVPMVAPDGRTMLTAGQGRPLILTTLDPEEAMRVLGSAHRHSILVGSLLMLVAAILLFAALVAVPLGL
jgi:hypothetical protein